MKIQTAFQLEEELLDELKAQAARNNRSLNTYVELILSKVAEKRPNGETLEAIEEVMHSKDLKPISNIDDYIDSI